LIPVLDGRARDERLREEPRALMGKKEDARTFLISVAAELAGMHAQTLRTYDRLGLVSPQRSSGGGRRYSQHDVDLLREVQRLSQDEGVNLAGIKRIIELTNQVEALQARLRELAEELEQLRARQRRDVAVLPKSTAVVVWQPRNKR
jgi:MerR family transcriptional regulator/heat shock protein HspR